MKKRKTATKKSQTTPPMKKRKRKGKRRSPPEVKKGNYLKGSEPSNNVQRGMVTAKAECPGLLSPYSGLRG